MKSVFIAALVSLTMVSSVHCFAQESKQSRARSTIPETFITYCALDGVYAGLHDDLGQTLVAEVGDVQLYSGGLYRETGSEFWFSRQGEKVFSFDLSDLSVPAIWVTTDRTRNRFALTYSDGGAVGGFHVRIFQIENGEVVDLSPAIQPAVTDFKSRHYCETRGNNVQALKWVDGNLLLLTDVYPTGDCGPDLGHAEGYVISIPSGQIKQHLTLQQLKRFPDICLQNDSRR